MIIDKLIRFPISILLIVTLNTGSYCSQSCRHYASLLQDNKNIAVSEYTSVFFSAFPIDYYSEEDYSYYRGLELLKTARRVTGADAINDCLFKISQTDNSVSTVYIGIRPDLMTADELLSLVENWNDKFFEVIIAYPSMQYWQGLDEEECFSQVDAYTEFINTVMARFAADSELHSHLNICFYGFAEWLVGNPANYESDFGVNPGISHSLAMYSDSGNGYQLTLENYEARLEEFRRLVITYRTEPASYPDLSEWDVVFFGDSVIAYTATSSIPGAFAGLTNAHTYNCGLNGSSASLGDDEFPSLCAVMDAFLNRDLSLFSQNSQIYSGMTDFYDHSEPDRPKLFVLNYGLNDYYQGHPVTSEDPYDLYTYSGALRSAVERLENAYPGCRILLMAPNFTSCFNNGTEAQSAVSGVLSDYVESVLSLSAEKNTLVFDSYHRLGIDGTNHGDYLADGTHPNEKTRYLMARLLADTLKSLN